MTSESACQDLRGVRGEQGWGAGETGEGIKQKEASQTQNSIMITL